MARGVIFDLDGVLVDTVELHYRSWQRLADELGLPFSRAANERLRGRSRWDALELFLDGRSSPLDSDSLLARKNRYFLAYAREIGPDDLSPGAGRLLRQARERGVRIGLASSSRNARLVCGQLGILPFFDAFADGASGLRPKPAPDSFLWVAGGLGLRPDECTVVEDAQAGVEAALTGGFRVVGLGPRERVGKAHLVLPGMADLRVDDLLPASPRPTAESGPPLGAPR